MHRTIMAFFGGGAGGDYGLVVATGWWLLRAGGYHGAAELTYGQLWAGARTNCVLFDREQSCCSVIRQLRTVTSC